MEYFNTNDVVTFLINKSEYTLAKTINIICKEKTVDERLLKSYCGTLLFAKLNKTLVSV